MTSTDTPPLYQQCPETDLHVPHDWWDGPGPNQYACAGLDGTETDPDKPGRPPLPTDEEPLSGEWVGLLADADGNAVCGWDAEGRFHAWATTEYIATTAMQALTAMELGPTP